VQANLLQQFNVSTEASRGNLLFFDVQDDQGTGVADLVRQSGYEVVQSTPIVTMRVKSVSGRTVAQILGDTGRRGGWALRREYRSTYRPALQASETLVAGRWFGETPARDSAPKAEVSLEQDVAKELRVQLGDVVEEDHRASELTAFVSHRRSGELDGTLLPRGFAEQHRPAAQIVRTAVAASDRYPDRVGQVLAVVLIDEADDLLEQPADGLGTADAKQFLGGRIQIGEAPFDVGGDDGLAQRLHGENLQRRGSGRRSRKRWRHHGGARGGFLLVELAAGERPQFLRRDDFHAGHQQRRRPFEIDQRGS
jgi:hypothetical protein